MTNFKTLQAAIDNHPHLAETEAEQVAKLKMAGESLEQVITENGGQIELWNTSTALGMWVYTTYTHEGQRYRAGVSCGGVISFGGRPHCPVTRKVIDSLESARTAFEHYHITNPHSSYFMQVQ